MLADSVRVGLLVAGLWRHSAASVRDDDVPQDLLATSFSPHPVQPLGRLGGGMVAALGELDEAVEDHLGPLHGGLVPPQDDLIPPHDDLALDQVFDPPQDRVPFPEDLQHVPRWHHQLGIDLTFGCSVRLSSSLIYLKYKFSLVAVPG